MNTLKQRRFHSTQNSESSVHSTPHCKAIGRHGVGQQMTRSFDPRQRREAVVHLSSTIQSPLSQVFFFSSLFHFWNITTAVLSSCSEGASSIRELLNQRFLCVASRIAYRLHDSLRLHGFQNRYFGNFSVRPTSTSCSLLLLFACHFRQSDGRARSSPTSWC